MPQIFRVGPYSIYFWSNENNLLEPIHVQATANATKVWITSTGKTILSHNKSQIPVRILKKLMRSIEANSGQIIEKWIE